MKNLYRVSAILAAAALAAPLLRTAGRAAERPFILTKRDSRRSAPRAQDRDVITAAGLSLSVRDGRVRVDEMLARSNAGIGELQPADSVFYRNAKGILKARRRLFKTGLRRGDVLRYLNGHEIASLADAARALGDWEPGVRLGAVVGGPRTRVLSSRLHPVELPLPRKPEDLTFRERRIRDSHLADAHDPGRIPPLTAAAFTIGTGEPIWLNFPEGIPKSVRTGDILEGRTSTPMCTDAKLDFIAIPQGSRVWARAVSVRYEGAVTLVRLHIHKIRPVDGKTYPLSAMLTDVSGGGALLRISKGGTIVAASPETAGLLVGPDTHLQARLLEPLTLFERASFFLAGPGLWFRTAGKAKRQVFEVTHVIPGRSAERAGVRKGDQIHYIASKHASSLGFTDGLRHLYGPQGSKIEIRVLQRGSKRFRRVQLVRGVYYKRGLGMRIRPKDGELVVRQVHAGSPAERAGLKEGCVLLKVGDKDLSELDETGKKKLLREELADVKAVTVETPEGRIRTATLKSDWYALPLSVKTSLQKLTFKR